MGGAVSNLRQNLVQKAGLQTNQVRGIRTYQFKLFEYVCPNCKEKRAVQYFHRDGRFLDQKPHVLCGGCGHDCSSIELFKTVDFECPCCSLYRKVRIPAKPVPLDMYKSSVVTCDKCFFRGEVPVGKLMHMICESCLSKEKRLADVWTENGASQTKFCGSCQRETQQIAMPNKPHKAPPPQSAPLLPVSGGASSSDASSGAIGKPEGPFGREDDTVGADGKLHFQCENCMRNLPPIAMEDLLKNHGMCSCSKCGWYGVPEEMEAEEEAPRRDHPPRTGSDGAVRGPGRSGLSSWRKNRKAPFTD